MGDLTTGLGIGCVALLGGRYLERWFSFRSLRKQLRATQLPDDDFGPVSMIHWVDGERVHVLALRHREGGWQARVCSTGLAYQVVEPTPELADMRGRDLFWQAFPHHRCNRRCLNLSSGNPRPDPAHAGVRQ